MPKPPILVVDDSPLDLLAMREVLTKHDFQVTTFQIKSFAEVFQLSEVVLDVKPALILMDVNLGLSSYDGVRLAKTIGRLCEPGEAAPLIVLHSSLAAAELLALQRKCDADGYLEKGELSDLPMKVKLILSRLVR